MTVDKTPKGTTADWIANKALHALLGVAMQKPYAKRVPFMGSAVAKAIGPLAGYSRRARNNLSMIYPEMSQVEKNSIATAACDNFGRTLIENYSYSDFAEHLIDTPAGGQGLEALDKAKIDKIPVLFVTGHFGNHEAARQVLTRMGHTIGGVFRPMANPYFNEHYAKTMTNWGGPVFPQGRQGTIGFVRHIRSGGMGTLLFDVNSDTGQPIKFLGKEARTALSAAEIALKFKATVIPYFSVRKSDGLNFDIHIEAPIELTDPVTMTEQMNRRLEARIEKDPEQWFWVHRRWKNKMGRLAQDSGS